MLKCFVSVRLGAVLFFFAAGSCACTSSTVSPADEKLQTVDRKFIAHRGVNLGCTIAGENSLEAIRLASIAGFDAVETDVRLTADSVLVVMHDNTLNRTCLNADGSELKEKTEVAALTLDQLKSQFILKATAPGNRTPIPTLREYLAECKKSGMQVFIEPKLMDETGKHYRNIIREADEVLGKNNYIITSNNRANVIIRKLGLNEVPLMGILYQTTFGEIESLKNIIMAISTSQFSVNDYAQMVAKAKATGLQTESSADNFSRFTMINDNDIDYISTDYLAPDLTEDMVLIANCYKFSDFTFSGRLTGGTFILEPGQKVELRSPLSETGFGAVYLEIEMKGNCTVVMGNQEFTISNQVVKSYRHQLMIFKSAPAFRITAAEKSEIRKIRLKVAKF